MDQNAFSLPCSQWFVCLCAEIRVPGFKLAGLSSIDFEIKAPAAAAANSQLVTRTFALRRRTLCICAARVYMQRTYIHIERALAAALKGWIEITFTVWWGLAAGWPLGARCLPLTCNFICFFSEPMRSRRQSERRAGRQPMGLGWAADDPRRTPRPPRLRPPTPKSTRKSRWKNRRATAEKLNARRWMGKGVRAWSLLRGGRGCTSVSRGWWWSWRRPATACAGTPFFLFRCRRRWCRLSSSGAHRARRLLMDQLSPVGRPLEQQLSPFWHISAAMETAHTQDQDTLGQYTYFLILFSVQRCSFSPSQCKFNSIL